MLFYIHKENDMYKKVWKLLAPFHRTFVLLVLMLVVYESCGILESYAVSFLVRLFELKVQLVVWALVAFSSLAFNEVHMRLDNNVDWHIIARQSHPIYKFLKLSAVSKFLKMDISWHQHHNSGTLVGQVSDGVWKTLEIVDQLSWEFVPTAIQTLLSMVPLVIITPWVALLASAAFALFVWLTLKAEKVKWALRSQRQSAYEDEWSESVQCVQGHETVVMFGQQQRMLDTIAKVHDQIIDLAFREHRLGVFVYNRWRIRILTSIRLIIYVVWIHQLYAGTIDVANLIFASVLTEKLLASFWRFARLADRVYNNSEAVKRLVKLMDEPEPQDSGSLTVAVDGPVGISLKNVCFAYDGNGTNALHELNLDIPPGSNLAIVGPSGAGKTTLRNVITKLVDFQCGEVEIAGLNIRLWKKDELLKLFSFVPQGDSVYVFDSDVRFNIAFPRPDASDEEVAEAARLAGIHDFIISLKDGYQTLVGERGVRLSGGQKQRLALARAILADRPVLILDEATSAVDAITEREIQTNMRTILAGKTAIIIAHRLSTIWDLADKIVVLDQGKKVEEGTHQELVSLGGLYAKMVALQTTGEKFN